MSGLDYKTISPLCKSKEELQQIEEGRKDGVSLFDELLFPLANHQSNFVFATPKKASKPVELKPKESEVKVEETNSVFIIINSSTKIAKECIDKLTEQGANENGLCSCPRSFCDTKYCPCYKQKFECKDKCKCRDCRNKKVWRYKKLVMAPFWSIKQLL